MADKDKDPRSFKFKRNAWKKAVSNTAHVKRLGESSTRNAAPPKVRTSFKGANAKVAVEGAEGSPRKPEGALETFEEAYEVAMARANEQVLQLRDTNVQRSFADEVSFMAENLMARSAWAPFVALMALFLGLVAIFGGLWFLGLKYEVNYGTSLKSFEQGTPSGVHDDDGALDSLFEALTSNAAQYESLMDELASIKTATGASRRLKGVRPRESGFRTQIASTMGYNSLHEAIWYSVQLLAAGGVDDSIPDLTALRVIYFLGLLSGLVVFAILVGFITDGVTTFMESLNEGKTKVVTAGHTLVLGTNEATPRLVAQIAHMRRAQTQCNSSFRQKYLGIGIHPPSTSVAVAPVVVMTNTKEKAEMKEKLAEGLASRGIEEDEMVMGRDLMVRVGDSTSTHDLMRVSADTALNILIMMTERDDEERDASGGKIQNGATLRTILALRHVLFTSANDSPTRNIVIQLARPCKHMASATFCDDGGRRLIRPMDLSLFMNSLIFACAAQEGLAHVLMMLLDAEGFSFKRRKAHLFCGGVIGKTIGDCDDMLEKGAVIGVMPTNWGGEDVPPGMGLAPDMDYVVKRGDLIIFVSDTISPPPSSAHEDGSAAADVDAAKLLEPAEGFDTPHASMQALICGWRPVWTDESKRLRARIEQITLGMGAGSALYFLNAVPEDLFKRLIEVECGFSAATFSDGKAGWATAQGVELRHVPGDAADQDDLEPLVHAISFDVAIVLGSQARAAGDALSPANMDTRVLDILLLLRHVHATSPNPNKYLHVIGENNVDETAMLALAPRTKDSLNKPPDFINTQAIYARALTLTLAYPAIYPAIAELFDDGNSGASVRLVRAARYLPLHVELKWNVVQARVIAGPRGHEDSHLFRRICIAILTADNNKIIIDLANDDVRSYCDTDRLVVIERKV